MTVLVNLYATVREPPSPAFAQAIRARRDRSDPELLSHLQGFMGFVMGGGQRPMTASLFHVIGHLQRVQHHLSVEIEDDGFDALATWAVAANAILFLPDGSVRDPLGHMLVDPRTGEADPDARVPYPADAVERKLRSDRALSTRGIPTAPGLPPVVGEDEVVLRAPEEVFHRACALLACAIRAESLGAGTPIEPDELRARLPEAFVALTPSEQAFLSTAAPKEQAIVEHAWRYESLWSLLWALGLLADLPAPNEICDVSRAAATLVNADRPALLREATLRPVVELLDALDEHFRLHWAIREARRTGTSAPDGLEPGVVAERHRALNWLVRFQDAAWDDVDTPT